MRTRQQFVSSITALHYLRHDLLHKDQTVADCQADCVPYYRFAVADLKCRAMDSKSESAPTQHALFLAFADQRWVNHRYLEERKHD